VIDDNPTIHSAFEGILRGVPANETLEREEVLLFGQPTGQRTSQPECEIDHAVSGLEGVHKVIQALENDRPYQVAFVDIRMPGIDGVETIERIWKLDARLQTVICTAYADYRWEDLARRLENTDRLLVLKKPFHDIEVKQLASTLAEKWFVARQAELKFEQMEILVAQRTRNLLDFHQREHQQIHELDQSKLHYLAGLAQEFRGPLTLILNPIEDLMHGAVLDRRTQESIQRNVRALLQLVDDSLALRKLEPDEYQVNWQRLEASALLRGMTSVFSPSAGRREIQIEVQAEELPHVVWTDASKLEKVLFRLFTRVLDLTADRGRITAAIRANGDAVEITLDTADSRHCQECGGDTNPADSWGPPAPDAALLLNQEMIRLLGGQLAVERLDSRSSKIPEGIRITLTLPVKKAGAGELPATEELRHSPNAVSSPGQKEPPLILLIEHDADVRGFIRQGLDPEYRVVEAASCAEGFGHARESVPDLILIGTDLQGNIEAELSAKLKRNEITSHIPIILLAGDSSERSQLLALEAGVDDYVAKPFRLLLLKARVDNLLVTRRKLQEHFQHLSPLPPRELASNQVDAEFLRRAVEIIERNLADYGFDVDTLARQMAVSRRQLFRKLKAVSGTTPNVFIRDLRLKRAAQLLRESGLTVSEIIYAVGFSDLKYFRTIFRERFGFLPVEYIRRARSGEPAASGTVS
jgi:DNA-binding response OmpR family regulator